MSQRSLDNWIKAYLRYTLNTEAPQSFHYWTAVATIAGALQRKVYMDMGAFDWVPNFYIVLVGPAGFVTKSTTLRLGESLLRQVGKRIRFGSNSGSWQAMAEEIAASAQMSMTGGFKTCSISYFISELGTFLDPNNREQIDFFVDSWDAQRSSFTRSTKSSGQIKIECPCVNILSGTTPTWIKENFNATMIGGGFVSRLIFVHGKVKSRYIAYPGLHSQVKHNESLREQLIHDLVRINNLEGEMRLTQDAIEWGEHWYKTHYTEKRQFSGERFDGFYARKQTHLHKLAMILSVAENNSMEVTRNHLMAANEMLLLVEKDLAGVVENVTGKQISGMHKREILSIVAAEGSIDRDKLYSMLYQMMGGPDFDRAMSDLLKADQLTIRPHKGQTLISLKQTGEVIPLKK